MSEEVGFRVHRAHKMMDWIENEVTEWAFECPSIEDRSKLAPWVQVIISTDDFWVLFDKKNEFNNRYDR